MKGEMKEEIDGLIEKSRRSLKAAKRLVEDGDYDFAVSRAYYAIFYISEALLLKKGKSVSKHSAMMSAIFEEYIRESVLPKEFHETLHKAFDLRQEGDYLTSATITETAARELILNIEKNMGTALKKLKI